MLLFFFQVFVDLSRMISHMITNITNAVYFDFKALLVAIIVKYDMTHGFDIKSIRTALKSIL